MKVDPNLVKECIDLHRRASKLLEAIQKKVREFCEAKGIELFPGSDDPFDCIYISEGDRLMEWLGHRGKTLIRIHIAPDGEIREEEECRA